MPGIPITDYLASNPFRPPDWRWQRASWIITNHARASQKRDDDFIFRAVRFLRELQRVGAELGCRRLMRHYADIVLAVKCHQGDSFVRLELESRILGRQPSELIAEHLEVPLSLVDTYKTYFFDVADRIDAATCITFQIIGMAPCGTVAPEAHMKLFVYNNHGPAAIEPWLDYLRHQHELHDLKTIEGWQRDSIDVYLRAQELSYVGEDAKLLVKCSPIILGIWQQSRALRSVASVFQEKALQMLESVNWPAPTAKDRKPTEERLKTRRGRPTANPIKMKAG